MGHPWRNRLVSRHQDNPGLPTVGGGLAGCRVSTESLRGGGSNFFTLHTSLFRMREEDVSQRRLCGWSGAADRSEAPSCPAVHEASSFSFRLETDDHRLWAHAETLIHNSLAFNSGSWMFYVYGLCYSVLCINQSINQCQFQSIQSRIDYC